MYTWNKYENDDIWMNALFDTEEECISDAIGCEMKTGDTIYIGTAIQYEPYVDVDGLLEHMEYYAYDACGEVADDWDVSTRKGRETEYDELCEKVTAAVNEYLKKIGMVPDFYYIEDLHKVIIGEEE